MEFSEKICHAYFYAKQYVIRKGYGTEIDWQMSIKWSSIDEQTFLGEISWVILASGMNDKVVRKIFPQIKEIMFDFKSGKRITRNRKQCYSKAINVINHPGKINAIIFAAEYINTNSFEYLKTQIQEQHIPFIQTFPYMGKATAFHLAKNLGLDVAKPDRHLMKIADVLGFSDTNELCSKISQVIQEKRSLIDLVIWRYATLNTDYVNKINRFINKPG